jgi:hypothetical protein
MLEPDDRTRTHEVARMVSGAKVTETSHQHAAQMIAAGRVPQVSSAAAEDLGSNLLHAFAENYLPAAHTQI